MLVVVSDTHRTDRPGLTASLREAIRSAALVVHAGDFTTEAVLDGFRSVSREFHAVHGNRDTWPVEDQLPAAHTLEFGGRRIAVTHTQRGGETGLRYFGAEREADLVVSGHTHRPHVETDGDVALLNPGSHTSPRGAEATYAVLRSVDGGLAGEIRTENGEVRRQFVLEGRT
jgi:hypothetical protein